MGQITQPSAQSLILTATDRLVAANAAGGMAVGASHIIALGANAAANITAISGLIALGESAASGLRAPGCIVLGQFALDAGFTTVADADLIVIGNRSMGALTSQASTTYGFIALGSDIAPLGVTKNLDGFIGIGSEIMTTDTTVGDASNTIVIGHGVRRNGVVVGVTAMAQAVVIGNNIMRDNYVGVPMGNSVFVGYGIARTTATGGFQASDAVIIGANTDTQATSTPANADFAVIIGASCLFPNGGSGSRNAVALGYGNSINGTYSIQVGSENTGSRGTRNTILGRDNNFGTSTFASSILIGNFHTDALTAASLTGGNMVAIAPGPANWVLHGNGNNGNITLGNSAVADRDLALGGTNRIKLVNGTVAGGLPLNGGYFYLTAGQLRWVNQNGVDSVLSSAYYGIVATLPAGIQPGERALVTDALAPVFGAAVVGGGAVVVPVYWTGAAWFCG